MAIAIARYSPAEVRNAARLAARGAGFSWGVADDIGRAAAWLSARGMRFCAATLARARDSKNGFCPPKEDAILRGELIPSAPEKMLCPFVSGILICDLARARLRWKLSRVANPRMLIPFVAFAAKAARAENNYLKIQWQNAAFITDGETVFVRKNANADASCADVRVSVCAPPCDFTKTAAPVSLECKIATKEWRRLNKLAARTLVPATEESRRGAGATEDGG